MLNLPHYCPKSAPFFLTSCHVVPSFKHLYAAKLERITGSAQFTYLNPENAHKVELPDQFTVRKSSASYSTLKPFVSKKEVITTIMVNVH